MENKSPRFLAGYEAGFFYVAPSPETRLGLLMPLINMGYEIRLDMHGILLKKRCIK
jgi:hypothetical protein